MAENPEQPLVVPHQGVPVDASSKGELSIVAKVFLEIADQWRLTPGEIANTLGLDDSREVTDLRAGHLKHMARDTKYRMGVALTIAEALEGLLPMPTEQLDWLKQPRVRLGNKSVLDLIKGDSIEDLLRARDLVYEFVGR